MDDYGLIASPDIWILMYKILWLVSVCKSIACNILDILSLAERKAPISHTEPPTQKKTFGNFKISKIFDRHCYIQTVQGYS